MSKVKSDPLNKFSGFNFYIKLYQDYNELLDSELSETVSIAFSHGWRSTRHEQGVVLRNNIEKVTKEISAIK